MRQVIQVLYFADHIVLEVESFEIDILLKTVDPINHFVVQIQFFIHLRVFIESFYLAEQFEVSLVQDEAALLSPFEISIFAGIFLDDFVALSEFLEADAG